MIDYIIFGEFDINEGNVIRIEYPSKIGISDMTLSSYIIPEGTHNIMTDTFCFIINRFNNPEETILSNSKNKMESLSKNSTKYFDLERNLKNLQIENKIYKVKQIYTFDDNLSDWTFVQNIEKDVKGIKGKTETSINNKNASNNSNGKLVANISKTSSNNFNNTPNMNKKFFYLIIQKDKSNQFYNMDFYESNQENFIYSSNTPPPVLTM